MIISKTILRKKSYLTPIEYKKLEFQSYKAFVIKHYPNSIIKCYNNKFYIDNGYGDKIIASDMYINNSSNIFDTWKQTAIYLDNKSVLSRNNYKFSDEKIYDSFIKKQKDKESNSIEDDSFNF